MNLLEENYNDIKQIKEVINEIKYNQQKTIQIVEKNHKTNMKKIEKLQEFNNYIVNKKVAIIGMGVSNIPLLDYFYKKNANVTIFDKRNIEDLDKNVIEKVSRYNMGMFLGENHLSNLKGFDIIFRSPSCRPDTKEIVEEVKRGAILTSEIEMLMELCPGKIIGITGSDGKTTTTSLIYEIIKKKGYNCYLGGNIGIPLFTKVDEMTKNDIVILELSSFQLMNMKISPDISVITNITPNHLNVHKDYQEYINAKKNIYRNQKDTGILVINADNDLTRECQNDAKGDVILFSSKQKLDYGFIVENGIVKECNDGIRKHIVSQDEIKLKGIHNLENICTALALTKKLVNTEKAVDTIKEFAGVHHRLELVRTLNGVEWYNDSASTTPTRGISALKSFNKEIVLIAGGADKNLDYTPIAKPIVEKVKSLILIGQTANKIYTAVKNELENQNKTLDIHMCETFRESLELAKRIAKPGQIVLFSPASTSFDMFKDMYDRGDQFREEVNKF